MPCHPAGDSRPHAKRITASSWETTGSGKKKKLKNKNCLWVKRRMEKKKKNNYEKKKTKPNKTHFELSCQKENENQNILF